MRNLILVTLTLLVLSTITRAQSQIQWSDNDVTRDAQVTEFMNDYYAENPGVQQDLDDDSIDCDCN